MNNTQPVLVMLANAIVPSGTFIAESGDITYVFMR
jgi:hypothetical protein